MQIINQIIKLIPNSKQQKMLVLKNIDNHLYDKILELTRYLSDETNLTTRMKFIDDNYNSLIKCRVCNTEHQRLDDRGNISLYCSGKCYNVDPNKIKDNWKTVDQKSKMDKLRATNKEKYGYEYNSQRSDVKTILRKSKLEKNNQYALEKLNDREWLYEQYITNKLTLLQIADELKVFYGTVSDYLRKYDIEIRHYINRSSHEIEICSFIQSLNINVIQNSKSILNNIELDVYCPDFNFAIELNGLFWHSSIEYNDKATNRHLNKTNKCRENNILLYHFTDEMWINKTDICKSMIKNKLGLSNKIYARKCEIKEINIAEYREFCNSNHISGYTNATYKFGLFHNNELVQIISFSKPRFDKEHEYEIIRLCTKLNMNVIGGASKLYKHFIRLFNPSSIISYADRQYSEGNVYNAFEMNFLYNTDPGYKWSDGHTLHNRMNFQKHKLKNVLKIYDEKLSERENMFNNNYKLYWDCGQSVWSYKNPLET